MRTCRPLLLPAAVAALVLACLGCATPVPYQWDDPAGIPRVDAARFPRANAVELLRVQSVAIGDQGGLITERVTRRHRVLILTEAGLKLAEQHIEVGLHAFHILTHLHARVISPRGESRELGESDITREESHPLEKGEARSSSFLREEGRLLRFPGVEVGSILEWEYSVDSLFFTTSGSYELVADLPVLHSEVEVLMTRRLKARVRVYNAKGLEVQDLGDVGNYHRWGVATGVVQADRVEELRPPRRLRVPTVEFQVTGFADGDRQGLDTFQDWNGVARSVAAGLPSPDLYYFDRELPTVDTSACHGRRGCIASAALKALHGAVRWNGIGLRLGRNRQSKVVLSSGQGTSTDLGFMLFRLLDRAGVTPTFAVTGGGIGILDVTAPSTSHLDYLLLQLPPEHDGEPPLWLDPACEYCAAGEVSPLVRGRSALLLRRARTFPTVQYEADHVVVAGDSRVADGQTARYQATLDPASGDLEVRAEEEWTGTDAVGRILRTEGWSDDQFREDAEGFVHDHAGSLSTLVRGPEGCDRLDGRCARTLTFRLPGYAAASSGRLFFPTTLLHHPLDGALLDEERRHDLATWNTSVDREELVLPIPAGYRLDALPGASRANHPAVEATLTFAQRGEALVVTRTVKRTEGRWDRAQYPGVRATVRALTGMRHRLVTLTRAGGGG